MNVNEAIAKRRAIRKFKDVPVPYDIIEKCIDAARLAPVARNRQLLEYIIVDDEGLLPKVLNTIGSYAGQSMIDSGLPMESRPMAYIITLINRPLEAEFKASRIITSYDVGLAVENITLMALEEGLGSFVIASFDHDKLRKVLAIPEKYDIALGLGLGFPDESPVVEIATDSIQYWVDDNGVRHVPKRQLKDILHRSRFS